MKISDREGGRNRRDALPSAKGRTRQAEGLPAGAIRNLGKLLAITRTPAAGARSATRGGVGGEIVAEEWIMRPRKKSAAGGQ